jgi:hypothetical protein
MHRGVKQARGDGVNVQDHLWSDPGFFYIEPGQSLRLWLWVGEENTIKKILLVARRRCTTPDWVMEQLKCTILVDWTGT